MEIEIPSPSVFLTKSPILSTAPPPPSKKPVKPRNTSKSKPILKDGAVQKPKQSKSRNGCMTCKKKRLKCDETKPSCTQCQKRNVECEGYKKDFKWRSFEEGNFNTKTSTKRRKSTENQTRKPNVPDENTWSLESAFATASHAFQEVPVPTIVSPTIALEPLSLPDVDSTWNPARFDLPSPGSTFELNTTPVPRDNGSHSSSFSGSPTFHDILAPGTDINQPPDLSEERPPLSPHPYCPDPSVGPIGEGPEEEADEEIMREEPQWSQPSPAPSNLSTDSKASDITILANPQLDMASAERLLALFDRNTCGILSVKDGPTENPWRTLIWPLAQSSPALYHALSSMTAFHNTIQYPQLRVAGMAHMHKSIKKLAADIENMHLDSALATSLALALGEGWDERTSTGIQHIRGAKIMVNNALVKHRQESLIGHITPEKALRLKFLCNTFVYLDVIARLTSTEEASELNFQDIINAVNPPIAGLVEVDPLMGCATELFPLIGRVANLIQRVRKTSTNTINVVSQANELRMELLHWHPPHTDHVARPEDPSSEVDHSIRTAEAYRAATLLYLCQAVPELSSDPPLSMAQRVLLHLASVPLSSRTVIVQIFPLFAASCELTTQEDRTWATERWAAMMARLSIGNVDSCWRVVKEVWSRRDEFEQQRAARLEQFRSHSHSSNLPRRSTMTDIPLGQIEPEYTVRGRLHWIGVMSNWRWEVFLG